MRSPGIDVLRGVAVLLVVLHHIHLRFVLNHYDVAGLLPEPFAKLLFWSGYYAVILFFVISGFLITSLSLRRWVFLDRMPLLHFYALRAARILPCLFVLLAVLSVLQLAGASDFVINPERASLGRALTAALTFHLNWLEGHRGYLPGNWDVLWSLSVEETFYLAFPLLCLAVRREGWVLVCLVALIAIGPFNRAALNGQDPWQDYAYLSCMDGIAFGCIAAWISTRVRMSLATLRVALILGAALVISMIVFRASATLLELGAALLLLGMPLLTQVRGTSLLQWVGRCSYEIYLVHMFVVLLLMHPFKARFSNSAPSHAAYWLAYGVMLAASVLLGFAVNRWFSEPINKALRLRFHGSALDQRRTAHDLDMSRKPMA